MTSFVRLMWIQNTKEISKKVESTLKLDFYEQFLNDIEFFVKKIWNWNPSQPIVQTQIRGKWKTIWFFTYILSKWFSALLLSTFYWFSTQGMVLLSLSGFPWNALYNVRKSPEYLILYVLALHDFKKRWIWQWYRIINIS